MSPTVIIVSRNGSDDTLAYLRSIVVGCSDVMVLVVVNGSVIRSWLDPVAACGWMLIRNVSPAMQQGASIDAHSKIDRGISL